MDSSIPAFFDYIEKSKQVVIVQADNPDADSLGSALALESILDSLGKKVTMYCGADIPGYLKYMEGWSRVENRLPKSYDTIIIVDASTDTLLEKLHTDTAYNAKSNILILDHHASVQNQTKAQCMINEPSLSSTGELIYSLCKNNELDIDVSAAEMLLYAILGDTQGLSNDLASADTYRVVASLLDIGVNRAKLEEKRREFSKMPISIYEFKASLITRTEFHNENTIAITKVNQDEINTYSPLYNPAALIQSDMLQIENVKVCLVFKTYNDGRITAAVRANNSAPIAAKLAEKLGGGGHSYASGFKITDGRTYNEVKAECVRIAAELIDQI